MTFDFSQVEGPLSPEDAALALASGGELGENSSDAPSHSGTELGSTESGSGDEHQPSSTAAAPEAAASTEQDWQAMAEAAAAREAAALAQLAALQAEAQQRAEAGIAPTRTDKLVDMAASQIAEGADASIFGDFSEESLARGIDTRIDQKTQAYDERLKKLEQIAAKQEQLEAAKAAEAHNNAIYSKHPDALEVANSPEFAAWVNSHPTQVREAYWALFDTKTGGTAKEIVGVFDAFKKSSTTATASTKAAASAAVAKAQANPPASLSSIPGARAEGASVLDRAAEMSGPEQLSAIQGLSPEQTRAWLDRQI